MSIEPEKPVQERPKIEFPCLYPIKVIGHAVDNFKEKVTSRVEGHTGPIAVSYTHLPLPTNREV